MRDSWTVAPGLDKGDNTSNANATQTYRPERLPPEAEQAIVKGSLRAVADVLRRVHRAAAQAGEAEPTRGSERAALNRRLRPKEEQALRGWAFKAELMIDAAEFTRKWRRGGTVEGAEQQVYPEGGQPLPAMLQCAGHALIDPFK